MRSAILHGTWKAKITIDSAAHEQGGFEVTEAKWLFGVPVDKIEVLIHPQASCTAQCSLSIGAVKAQLGVPHMRLPIQYASPSPSACLCRATVSTCSRPRTCSSEPDYEKFKCLRLAFEVIVKGGNMSCIVNAANEVSMSASAVASGFLQMGDIIEQVMAKATFDSQPDLDVYLQTDAEARRIAAELMKSAS